MKTSIEKIRERIEPLKQQIIHHPIYASINTIDHLKIFMQYHVYAVWDFMSLLKTLQNNLTCTQIPWMPIGNADTRYLINEIVVGEESDIDFYGKRKSHFEMYLDAMKQCNADSSNILHFTNTFSKNGNLSTSFDVSKTPIEAAEFVDFTFKIIHSKKSYLQSAIFTFGREDLIPGMFLSMVKDLDQNLPNQISLFKYYLERHIEIDGNHHSHLALQMTTQLCGNNPVYWQEAENAVIESLEKRILLWNGIQKQLDKIKKANLVLTSN